MDAIVTAALIGTAQQQNIDISTSTPVDILAEKLTSGETERKLLLSAGAWALYKQAGRVTDSPSQLPEPAAPETLPPCSAELAALLESMLEGEQQELLPEALACIRRAALRIPHELLPTALAVQGTELRSAMLHLIGERGRWLSQFNPAWSWVSNYLPEVVDAQLANAVIIWLEGNLAQRQAVLRFLRATDPTRAREWLSTVWKQEKADVRSDLLATLEIGLSSEDEQFLEKALDDRAASVRSAAASLLARLPTSALSQRMRERADAMLSFTAKTLTVTLPTIQDKKDWLRDVIVEKPPYGVGEYSWWFTQVLSQVPPTHWEERFGLSSANIIAAAYANDDWSDSLITSWSSAALLHKNAEWCMALWDWWCKKQRATSDLGVRIYLLAYMPQREAEERVSNIFNNPKHPARKDWQEALAALPKPWSQPFSAVYLQQLRNYLVSLDFKKNYSPYYDPWYQSISTAMCALSPACFAIALTPWTIPAAEQRASWQIEYWRNELHTFTEALRTRQRLIKETKQ